jgi:undecaprenyl-diphosphatase
VTQNSFSKAAVVTTFLIFALGLIALTLLVLNARTETFDSNVIERIQVVSTPVLTWFMIFISFFGDGLYPFVIFLAFVLLLIFKGYKKEAYFSFLVWLGPLFSWILKTLVARPRPQEYLVSGYSLPNDFGFPSGHAVFYVVFFGLVAFYAVILTRLPSALRKILFAVSIVLILLVGLSRIYLGVHWPVDVLAGYLLGFALLEVLIIAYLKFIYFPKRGVTG